MLCLALNSYGQAGMEYYKIGKNKAQNKDFQGAIMSFTTAIEMEDPEKFPHLYGIYLLERGNSKRELSDFRGAVSDISASIGWFNSYVLITGNANIIDLIEASYMSRAIAKLGINDLGGALIDVNEALELNPRSGDHFKFRGEIKILLGQKDSACLDFSRAGELGAEGAYERIKGNCN